MKSTRVVLYGRTSLDRSEGRSVDDQLAELRRWAAETGREVVQELRDDGISASRFARGKERPGWRAALDVIDQRGTDELALWETSRGSRDLGEWVVLVNACAERSVGVAVRGRLFDPTDPDDRRRLLYDAVDAEAESGRTSERTKRGARSRAANGRPHGRLNYGYRNEYDPQSGKVLRRVVDAEQQAVVREIARRLFAGDSAAEIAGDLTRRGIPGPAGSVWRPSNLTRLIKQPALAGLRVYRGEVLDDVRTTWEPILSAEEHRRLVALLTDPERRSSRTGAHIKHLLPGVAECGVCGGPVRAITRKRAHDRVIVYNCRAAFCFSRVAADVDDLVERVMIGYLSRPDVAGELAAGDPVAEDAADEVARLRAKLDEARRLVAEDRLSLASLVDVERRVLPQIEAAERAARPRHLPTAVFDVAGADAAARWAATPVRARREIVRALARVRIHRTGRRDGTVPFDPASVEIEWKGSA